MSNGKRGSLNDPTTQSVLGRLAAKSLSTDVERTYRVLARGLNTIRTARSRAAETRRRRAQRHSTPVRSVGDAAL